MEPEDIYRNKKDYYRLEGHRAKCCMDIISLAFSTTPLCRWLCPHLIGKETESLSKSVKPLSLGGICTYFHPTETSVPVLTSFFFL